MNKSHQLVKEIYSTGTPNEDIPIAEEFVEIKHKNLSEPGEVKVIMSLLPKPQLFFKIKLQKFPFHLFELTKEKSELVFLSRGKSIEVLVTNIIAGTKECNITAIPFQEPIIFSTSRKASKIIFHLLNFPNFLGAQRVVETIKAKPYPREVVILEYGDWQIIINAVTSYGEMEKIIGLLRAKGGYSITHVGLIKKSNEESFKVSEAYKILDALDFYLSFCRGYFTCTLLPIGFNKKNERVWERWGVRQADPWQYVFSWFDHHNGKLLSEVFPGFYKLWESEIWQKPIENAIYWYLKSNTQLGGTEGSIVMAQAALELLSWVHLTEEKKALSSEGFRLLHADDLIRLLLNSQAIKLEVPSFSRVLFKLANELNWDGPKSITEVRNFIIHPGKKNKRLSNLIVPYGEVWNLTLWYIELVLLHLFGYSGIYANRLQSGRFIGQVSSVPWITN